MSLLLTLDRFQMFLAFLLITLTCKCRVGWLVCQEFSVQTVQWFWVWVGAKSVSHTDIYTMWTGSLKDYRRNQLASSFSTFYLFLLLLLILLQLGFGSRWMSVKRLSLSWNNYFFNKFYFFCRRHSLMNRPSDNYSKSMQYDNIRNLYWAIFT